MCLSNGSSEFGNPTLLFFVIAVKCSLPACLRAILRAFQIENGSSSICSTLYAHSPLAAPLIVIFIIFHRLNFSIALSAAHFTDARRRECLARAAKESARTSFIDLILWRISLFVQLSFIYDFISGCYYDGTGERSFDDALIYNLIF
jgi:hypothetical protein